MGRLCYPTQAPGRVLVPRASGARKLSRRAPYERSEIGGARRVWRTFCRPGTNFAEHYECRGTSFSVAKKLSRYRILIAGTGAVSRYNLSRSQKFVKVQEFNCVQMRVSGCHNHYKFVLRAGAKAKSVTNNLPILSVLGCVSFFSCLIIF
jgi:hypothetical protein